MHLHACEVYVLRITLNKGTGNWEMHSHSRRAFPISQSKVATEHRPCRSALRTRRAEDSEERCANAAQSYLIFNIWFGKSDLGVSDVA